MTLDGLQESRHFCVFLSSLRCLPSPELKKTCITILITKSLERKGNTSSVKNGWRLVGKISRYWMHKIPPSFSTSRHASFKMAELTNYSSEGLKPIYRTKAHDASYKAEHLKFPLFLNLTQNPSKKRRHHTVWLNRMVLFTSNHSGVPPGRVWGSAKPPPLPT